MALTLPAVAVKLAVVEAAATVTEPGTDNAALLSERLTDEPPVGAAWDSVTVQVELPPEATLFGTHCNVVTLTAAGVTVTEAVVELPLSEAVTVTAWLALTLPAVAVKVAVVEPAATVTDAGTVRAALLTETATVAPPVGAAIESVAVQVEVDPEATLAGEHCRAETVGRTVIVPPEPETIKSIPFVKAPMAFVIGSEIVPLLVDARVAVATATTPLAIELEFRPLATQVTDPAAELQFRVSPAAVRAAPAAMVSEVTALVG